MLRFRFALATPLVCIGTGVCLVARWRYLDFSSAQLEQPPNLPVMSATRNNIQRRNSQSQTRDVVPAVALLYCSYRIGGSTHIMVNGQSYLGL